MKKLKHDKRIENIKIYYTICVAHFDHVNKISDMIYRIHITTCTYVSCKPINTINPLRTNFKYNDK